MSSSLALPQTGWILHPVLPIRVPDICLQANRAVISSTPGFKVILAQTASMPPTDIGRLHNAIPAELDFHLRCFLAKLLPDGLVYYHIVAANEQGLGEVGDVESSSEALEVDVFDAWATW
ncbi:hypothetical protein B0H19DRAFT_1374916 [Mycena capillaripes]|nr:hypothetical protein B0H19DRAFT_1374916 [Mycena capillaripes]